MVSIVLVGALLFKKRFASLLRADGAVSTVLVGAPALLRPAPPQQQSRRGDLPTLYSLDLQILDPTSNKPHTQP